VETKDVDPLPGELLLHGAGRRRREGLRAAVEALRKSGYSGVAKIAMHNREHIVYPAPGSRASCSIPCTSPTKSGK
jgi:hypothetical protein